MPILLRCILGTLEFPSDRFWYSYSLGSSPYSFKAVGAPIYEAQTQRHSSPLPPSPSHGKPLQANDSISPVSSALCAPWHGLRNCSDHTIGHRSYAYTIGLWASLASSTRASRQYHEFYVSGYRDKAQFTLTFC